MDKMLVFNYLDIWKTELKYTHVDSTAKGNTLENKTVFHQRRVQKTHKIYSGLKTWYIRSPSSAGKCLGSSTSGRGCTTTILLRKHPREGKSKTALVG